MSEKQGAQAQIAALVEQAKSIIAQAEAIADTHGLQFDFSLGYGMGGTYTGQTFDDWESSSQGEWMSSSQSC